MKKTQFQMKAILENGDLIDLVECGFADADTLEDAISMAQEALDFDESTPVSCVRIDSVNGFEGILDREGFHKD